MSENGIEILKQYDQIFLERWACRNWCQTIYPCGGYLLKFVEKYSNLLTYDLQSYYKVYPHLYVNLMGLILLLLEKILKGSMRKVLGEYIVGKMKLQSQMPYLLERVQNVRCGVHLSLLKPVDNM